MNKFLFPLTAVALCFTAHQAMAAAADGTGTAKAKIIAPITVTETTPMNFGTLKNDTAAYTVTLNTSDTRSGGDENYVNDSDNPVKSGEFEVTNASGINTAATLTVGNATIKDNNGTGSNSMLVDNMSHNMGANVPADGAKIKVGGTLHVGANQEPGTYTGTYNVTLSY